MADFLLVETADNLEQLILRNIEAFTKKGHECVSAALDHWNGDIAAATFAKARECFAEAKKLRRLLTGVAPSNSVASADATLDYETKRVSEAQRQATNSAPTGDMEDRRQRAEVELLEQKVRELKLKNDASEHGLRSK